MAVPPQKALLQDLHRLCREGDLERVRSIVNQVDTSSLVEMLGCRKGVLGFTPHHEAVANGHAGVLQFLLTRTENAHVNTQSNSGYTPLHLAASSGQKECAEILLEHLADMVITDEWGKTPLQAAELNARGSIIRLLKNEEMIRDLENDGEKLTEHLVERLQPYYLNRVLMIATRYDNHICIGKLVLRGARNLLECQKVAETVNKPQALAILLLIEAALSGNSLIVQKLFKSSSLNTESVYGQVFCNAQSALANGTVSTRVPIEMAYRSGHMQVYQELLLRTNMNRDTQSVQWNGLKLDQLDYFLLWRLVWVKTLDLARNLLKTLPVDVADYLKQVCLINLQHNELTTIPGNLFQLSNLEILDLSHNRLMEIPSDVSQWSPALKKLDLSSNKLKSLPSQITAPGLESLNLSHNNFNSIPVCVCSFHTLLSLDVGDNPGIQSLPARMGGLGKLVQLGLKNMRNLNDPPKSVQRTAQDCVRYLKEKHSNLKSLNRLRLVVLGDKRVGKTALVKALTGKKNVLYKPTAAGVNITNWPLRKQFYFNVWDFEGSAAYHTHQCFPSSHSAFLLLFDLKAGMEAVEKLKPWLSSIAFRAPQSCVILVGTHLDEVPDKERKSTDLLLKEVGSLATSYSHTLQVVEPVPVGLENRGENIETLRKHIVNYAAKLKTSTGELLMELKVPAGYFTLEKQMEAVQQEVREGMKEPIMLSEDFKTMVHQMKLDSVYSEKELAAATLFLKDIGSLAHYDVCSHNLNHVYFTDPQWLCTMFSNLLNIDDLTLLHDGILKFDDIPTIFDKNKSFPWKYLEQFLTLLDHCGIAFPLDGKRLLVPSFLPKQRPEQLMNLQTPQLFSRLLVLQDTVTPPDFWGRLLSRAIKFVPEIPISSKSKVSSHPQKDYGELEASSMSLSMNTPANTPFPTSESHPPFASQLIIATSPGSNHNFEVYNWQQAFQVPLSNVSQSFLDIPSSLQVEALETGTVHLDVWETGLYCTDSNSLIFGIESGRTTSTHGLEQKGVRIVTSANMRGKMIMVELVDLVLNMIQQWYPPILEHGLFQKIPCPECSAEGKTKPYEFLLAQCQDEIAKHHTTIECRPRVAAPGNDGHIVPLSELVPDLTCSYIEPEYLLDLSEIDCDFTDKLVIGKGVYTTVYQASYQDKAVAYKKYSLAGERDYLRLRSEARCLSQFHHPCLISLVGVHTVPFLAIISKLAPLGSLHNAILERKEPFPRLTVYRIAAQVAAALKFLHRQGIIHTAVEASNVLLWSLDPSSLCHCKLTGLGSSITMTPVGGCGQLVRSKGFVAPEALHCSIREMCYTYTHKVDVFSFGMLIYQMIARRINPFYNTLPFQVNSLVKEGKRPELHDVRDFVTSYYHLSELMKQCWEQNPMKRPNMKDIIKAVSLIQVQSIMCVRKISNCSLLYHAVVPTFVQDKEVWLFYHEDHGVKLNVYDLHSMIITDQISLKGHQVHSAINCNDYIWVGSRAGTTMRIFNAATHKLVQSIDLQDHYMSCLSFVSGQIVIGTMEGQCLFFSDDLNTISSSTRPQEKCISTNDPIDGIAFADGYIWVSHNRYIHFIHPETYLLDGPICRRQEGDACVGQLSVSPMGATIWSAHYGGSLLSSWDVLTRSHLFDIDANNLLRRIAGGCDSVITAMSPVLDTVWIGMATGHIMIFHEEELLTWYRPYTECVRFLSVVPDNQTSSCLVLSGGSTFIPINQSTNVLYTAMGEDGNLVVWEAFEAKTLRQLKLVEKNSPDYLDTFNMTRMMIYNGEFLDGTEMMTQRRVPEEDLGSPLSAVDSESGSLASSISPPTSLPPLRSLPSHLPLSNRDDSPGTTDDENSESSSPSGNSFEICLSRSEPTHVIITCPKPPKLGRLLSELQFKACLNGPCLLEFEKRPGDTSILLQSQQQFEEYLALPNRPKLFLAPNPKETSMSNSVYIY